MGLRAPIAILLLPLVGMTGTGIKTAWTADGTGAMLPQAGVDVGVANLSGLTIPSISSFATSSIQSSATTSILSAPLLPSIPTSSLEPLAEYRVSAIPTCYGLLVATAESERASAPLIDCLPGVTKKLSSSCKPLLCPM